VARFLALALPAAALALALVPLALAAGGWAPDAGPLAARGVGRPDGLPALARSAALGFGAVALVALYLLVEGRTPSTLADGVDAGLVAWTFSGPPLVVAVAHLTRLPTEPFWQAARIAFVALLLAGAAVGAVARWTRPPR
jgi:hypothetical protein